MEFEKCCIFTPADTRPAKRRRLEPQGLQVSWPLRKRAFEESWKRQQERIDDVLAHRIQSTINDVVTFLSGTSSEREHPRIPAGLVVAGPSSAPHSSFFHQLSLRVTKADRKVFAPLSASAATNLKTLLKSLIKAATSREDGIDEDDDSPAPDRRGPRLLNYDLQILHHYVREKNISQVVLAFEDIEAFDGSLLSEIIELLSCWQERIPLVCLFGIATSVEALEAKLSTSARRSIAGTQFDVAPAEETLEEVFSATLHGTNESWLGPNLCSALLERQKDYIQSIDSFVDGVKYAYMSSFYANALSLLLGEKTIEISKMPKDHTEALRNVPSFRFQVKRLLDAGETVFVRHLLDKDELIAQYAVEQLTLGRNALSSMLMGIEVVRTVQLSLPGGSASTESNLYIQAMSNNLQDSRLLQALLLSVRKAASDDIASLLEALFQLKLDETLRTALDEVKRGLEMLIADQRLTAEPLRSEDDFKNTTLRTTLVAQKVELSRQKSSLSKQDAAYTAELRRLTDHLEAYFINTFIDPKELPFHEIFVYDLKSPHREILTPRPRQAVERALAAPHDYLACSCCAPEGTDGDEATLSAGQPATAILYQLYLESGTLINARDLWSAFQAVVGDAAKNDEQTMALFQRALAELRYLALVKGTRKKTDHIAKVSWRGL